MASIFTQFSNWLFDYKLNSQIPDEQILSSTPISIPFILNQFLLEPRLCLFFNKYINNIHTHSLPKDELLKFIKQYIIKAKAKKQFINFFSQKEDQLKIKLKEKFPLLNNEEIDLLIKELETKNLLNNMISSLGIDEIKKQKLKKTNKKRKKGN
ncbi:MAG: hypothetical protein KatS3mg002_0353 [Candidatus Woesearchaeota archaeon]|nr:MAG: hypothetical protein KatS3mg002_0353 [Candidatus Woesearchaeota archaeon]